MTEASSAAGKFLVMKDLICSLVGSIIAGCFKAVSGDSSLGFEGPNMPRTSLLSMSDLTVN